jgi:hypothetical protein
MTARTGPLLWFSAIVGLWTTTSLIETIREILHRAYGVQAQRAFWEYRLTSIMLILFSVFFAMLALSAQFVVAGVSGFLGAFFPAVQSDALCEGEGSDAIRRALDEGRLHDFFCIVDQILRTYNSGSAYVQLDDWNGVNCRSCGDTVDSDQALSCSNCETELCMECSTCCDSCCERYCEECTSSCESCGNDTCKMCLKSCDDCGESFCPSCLSEGTCDDCLNNQNAANAEDEPEQSSPAIHSVCVGKAGVPA